MDHGSSRLAGKVAIVTGAGSSGPGIGIGKAIAVLLTREGCKVLLVDMGKERAEETLAYIRDQRGEATVFHGDVTKSNDCHDMVDTVIERYGCLDILVNNVGILGRGNVVNVEEENWDKVLEVNLKSMMLTSKHSIPTMIKSGGGSIINMSSFVGLRSGSPFDSVPYSTSKGGIIALTTVMAAEHGKDNIRVNVIAPGFIYTPMVAGNMSDEQRDLRRRAAPLQTEGTAWDVAWAALFLASDESRWITGVVLPVDAGLITTTTLAMLPYLQ